MAAKKGREQKGRKERLATEEGQVAEASGASSEQAKPQEGAEVSPYEHLLTALRYEAKQGPLNPFGALYRFFSHQWMLINKAHLERPVSGGGEAYREEPRGDDGAYRASAVPLFILVVASFSLTLLEYYGSSRDFFAFLRWLSPNSGWARGVLSGQYKELHGFAYWSIARFVGYMLIPCLAIWLFMRRESVLDYGLSLKSAQSHTKLYVTLYLMIAPVVFLVSYTAGFQKTYPFYSLASRSLTDFLVFEAFYAFQFFTLEFFFRGFLLHSIKRYVGAYAIFIMLVPYCMIHFGKPMSETLGAIGAGIILGTISLRTNSIWGGFGIHVAVAISMDVSSLWQKGLL